MGTGKVKGKIFPKFLTLQTNLTDKYSKALSVVAEKDLAFFL